MTKTEREPMWRSIAAFVLMLLICLTLYSTLITSDLFVDEMDVFLGSDTVARGGDVYKVFLSQHMPFTYYMGALVGIFHPATTYQWRMGFYIILSLIWASAYVRYRRHINRIALIAFPVCYLLQLPWYHQGGTMISDHWQGMGLAILLLELLVYAKERRISLTAAIWIAVGILLSFGTAFVSAYAVAVIAIGVCADQLVLRRKRDQHQRSVMLKQALRLVIICSAPFVVLLLWYAISDNIANFIEGAYTVNREVYSKYIGGFGTSATGALLDCFRTFIATTVESVGNVLSGNDQWQTSLFMLLHVISIVAVSLNIIFVKKHLALGLTWLVACVCAGMRGFNHYHGMAFICVGTLSEALVLGYLVKIAIMKHPIVLRAGAAAVAAGILLITGWGLPEQMSQLTSLIPSLQLGGEYTELVEYIQSVTADSDLIHYTSIQDTMLPVEAGRRIDYGASCEVPWMWEQYGQREIEALEKNRTPVVIYEEGTVLDGWEDAELDVYAAPLVEYITEHYTQQQLSVWLRNDRMEELMARRLERYPYKLCNVIAASEPDVDSMLEADVSCEQMIVAEQNTVEAVLLMTGTMARNRGGMTVNIYDQQSNLVTSGHIEADKVANDDYTIIPVTPGKLNIGEQYRIAFVADLVDGPTYITPYISWDTVTENCYAVIDDEPVDYSLMLMLGWAQKQ